jgi:hypothetical protein
VNCKSCRDGRQLMWWVSWCVSRGRQAGKPALSVLGAVKRLTTGRSCRTDRDCISVQTKPPSHEPLTRTFGAMLTAVSTLEAKQVHAWCRASTYESCNAATPHLPLTSPPPSHRLCLSGLFRSRMEQRRTEGDSGGSAHAAEAGGAAASQRAATREYYLQM